VQWELAASERDKGQHHDALSLILRMVNRWSQVTTGDGGSSASDPAHAPHPTTSPTRPVGRAGQFPGWKHGLPQPPAGAWARL
jgi:hypothetical protein